jgi:hypothetical protein
VESGSDGFWRVAVPAAPAPSSAHSLLPSSTIAVRQIWKVGGTIDTDDIDQTVAIANRDQQRLAPMRKPRLMRRDPRNGVSVPTASRGPQTSIGIAARDSTVARVA